jgi:hypothetical protein
VHLLQSQGRESSGEAAVRWLCEEDRGEYVVCQEGAGEMSDAVVLSKRPKGNISSVIAEQARRIEQLEADLDECAQLDNELVDCQVERDDEYLKRLQLEDHNALLRAFVGAWDRWSAAIEQECDDKPTLANVDAARAALDAAGVMGRE